jgi:hypothetical protein
MTREARGSSRDSKVFSPAVVPPRASRRATFGRRRALSPDAKEEMRMKKTLAVLATVAAVGAAAVSAPAQARGIGPGVAFGLAAGAITAGAIAASNPYYGPGYGYYGRPAYYGPGPYGYYGGGPYYYHHRYYRHW